ncbi:MAG: chromosomal replication initiator protein DnaA [Anaerolineales bacterium]
MDANQLWQTALGQLELQLDSPTYDTWIKDTEVISYEDDVLVVGVHSAYAKDWLENRLYADIQRTVTNIANHTTNLRFIVQRNTHDGRSDLELLEKSVLSQQEPKPRDRRNGMSRVNPKYRFDNFIVGQSNRLAHAGCLAVAENPGLSYNPLFIYGGVGLGKTHLLHAIGNKGFKEQKKVLYVSAETFTNGLINAIRDQTTDDFRAKYRTIDILLLDDVQFLINKERTQEEFFHTFNDLYHENRQIVLSSDRPPKAFVGLEERLRSRFEWGLTADIQAPDLETRMAIVVSKAEALNVTLPSQVVEFIAQQSQSNIRELEGSLNSVLALTRMMDYPINLETAEKALGHISQPTRELTIDNILNTVAEYFNLRVDDLTGRRRTRAIAVPRQVGMYLARELTDLSFPQIGDKLGGRDHTTIMHGHDKIEELFDKDDELRQQVLDIKSKLYGNRQRVHQPN